MKFPKHYRAEIKMPRAKIQPRPVTHEPEPEIRDKNGQRRGAQWMRDQKTEGWKGTGRPKGVPNKVTVNLKHAIMQAAVEIGEDGAGEGGLVGFLKRLEIRHPPSFARLLCMLLPLHIRGEMSEKPVGQIEAGKTSVQDAVALYLETLRAQPAQLPSPRVIEHDDMTDVTPDVRPNGRAH